MGGNIIWSPGIEEVVNVDTQNVGGKGGGGGSATTTTYTYFCSFAMAFSEGIADAILRLWGDGKMIRSEEHPSELHSLMRISYAVFCLQKNNIHSNIQQHLTHNVL